MVDKMKKVISVLMCVCIGWIIMSCGMNEAGDNEVNNDYDIPEELTIFIVSDAVHEYYQSEDRENIYYTTMMSVGDFDITTTTYGEKGFMYYNAFKNYTEETGINLNIHWYERSYEMEADLDKMDHSEWPDLILTTNTTTSDYYRYMEEEYFYDLTAFCEKEIYTSEDYYERVINAGKHNEKQYIMPILFNIDTIMGSETMWKNLNLHVEGVEKYTEMIDALIYSQKQEEVEQLAVHFGSEAALYLPHALYSATGENWVDYANRKVTVDEAAFRKMGQFYEYFLEEQFEEGVLKGEKIPWGKSKHMAVCMAIENEVQLDDFLNEIGCFIEGGGSFQTYLHSAIAQAWYYESRYRDMEQEFEVYTIPGIDGGTTAHVSYLGAVMNTSEYPRASFEFLKYLMDSEISAFFGLSVNRENTQKQLDYLTDTAYYLRPGLQIRLKDGTLADSAMDYLIQPMSQETRIKLEEYIDDIESVSLPNWPVYEILDTQLQRYAKGECSNEEAYQKAISELNNYVEEIKR